MNPVNGAMGLLSTGNWHICEAAVQTVLAGGSPVSDHVNCGPEVDESSEGFQMMVFQPINVMVADRNDEADLVVSCRRSDGDEEPKLLKLFE